jgi:hypothetical protein
MEAGDISAQAFATGRVWVPERKIIEFVALFLPGYELPETKRRDTTFG